MNLQIENKQVFFTDTGESFDKSKHSIILLHGSGQSHVVWSLTTQYLSDQNYNVFALDFPGHGNSDGDSLKTIEEMAEWLDKVININVPTLIIHGEDDPLIRVKNAKASHRLIKNSKLKIIPKMRHLIEPEILRQFENDLLDHLRLAS